DERRNILMRIGDQIRVVEKSGEFLENQENKFAAELQSKIDVAKSLPPSDGWAELRAEEIKLQRPPKQIKKLEFFKIWANKFRAEQKKNENGITTRLNEIQRNFTEKKSVAVLQKDREWLAKLNPRFKLEAKITPAPIPLELELLAQLKIAGESADTPTSSPRENLFLAQKNNEFIRRMLIQIAALAMAMGQTSTANETQKQIVKGQDLRERKNFKTTEEEKFKQAAAQQTTRQVSGAEIGANTDTLAAVKDPNVVQIHNSCAEIREESQLGFQIDSWEMTRFNGTKPWPPHELQKYLQDVRRSGHHLALTNNYLMVGHGFAMNLLKQITVANFIELLGNSAREKKICKDEIFSLINEAGGGKADDLDRRIFSYTPNE
ncbi:hypothetical protein KAI54_02700, partial [Candidatus Gracilibacteria bacterium]|nr:hypothetical protein [Candidatus Gracilibacteria bacterium]